MADARTFVAVGDTYTGSDAAVYFETTNPALIQREAAGDFDEGTDLLIDAADFAIDVDDLVRIAQAATTYAREAINGNMDGAYEFNALATLLREAHLLEGLNDDVAADRG